MKKTVFAVVLIAMIFIATIPIYASENSVKDIFPKEAGELLSESGFSDLDLETLVNLTPNDAVNYIIKCLKNEINAPFIMIYVIFFIIVITSIASGINGGFLNAELEKNFSAVSVLSICSTAVVPIISCLDETRQFISQMNSFVQIFVPVLSGAMITSGQTTSGAGYQMVMIFASEFMSVFLSGIIIPLVFIYLAFAIVGRTVTSFKTDSITSMIKSTVNWSLSLLMSLFVAIVTIKGLIGTGADSVALRTGRFFVGSFVPAVGGALAEAAATVQKSVGVIKNTTGVFGIISSAIYFIPPLVKILLYKFTCNITAIIGELLGADKISGLLKDVSAVLGLTVSVILSYGTLFVLSTAVTLIINGG